MSAGVINSPSSEVPVPTPCPLRFEPVSAFETIRQFLRDVAFEEHELCRRLEVESLNRFRALRHGRPATPLGDATDALIRLFLDNEPMSWSDAQRWIPAAPLEAMHSLGLLRDHRSDPRQVVSNVLLYPTESLFMASDVAALPEGGEAEWWDVVYAAITSNTRTFMSTIPRSRCAAFLELCAGTGVAALAAGATFADRAWAVDVTSRSTEFARFNARLNALDTVTAMCGDLYAPVAGMTFDRIVAHPPYVPSRQTTLVYRDGGSDGEDVTRRIIAGLPDHLGPGGSFYCTCTATDRADAPLEHRLRTMLGERGNEFDIAVVITNDFNPTQYYVGRAVAGRDTWQEAEAWHKHFAALDVTKMVYATVAIVRHEHAHEPYTVRRRAGSRTGGTEVAALLHAAEISASPGALERLLDSRPVLPTHVALESTHIREGSGWAVRTAMVSSTVPFDVRLPCPPEMITVLARMDGTRTVRELYADLSAADSLAEGASIDRLASYIHMLASHGFVEL